MPTLAWGRVDDVAELSGAASSSDRARSGLSGDFRHLIPLASIGWRRGCALWLRTSRGGRGDFGALDEGHVGHLAHAATSDVESSFEPVLAMPSWRSYALLVTGLALLSLAVREYLLPRPVCHRYLTALEVAENALRQHLEQRAQGDRRRIPRVIHQSWKDTDFAKAPIKVLESIVSFQKLNTDYTYILWTDSEIDRFVAQKHPDILDLWEALPHPIYRADLSRYLLLATYGGIYSDVDTKCLKPAEKWFPQGWGEVEVVVGVETDGSLMSNWDQIYPRKLHICQWTIASAPGSQFMERVVAESVRRLRLKLGDAAYMKSERAVLHTGGPVMFTDQLHAFLKDHKFSWRNILNRTDITFVDNGPEGGSVAVFPITGFSPGVGHMGSQFTSDPMAKVEHRFAGTWRKGGSDTAKMEMFRKTVTDSPYLRHLYVPKCDVRIRAASRTGSSWPAYHKLDSYVVADSAAKPDEFDRGVD